MKRLSITIVAGWLCACGAQRAIYGDPAGEGNVADALDAQAMGDAALDGGASGDGLRCPPLPEGRPLMPHLAAGWAVQGQDTTLLQFGSHPFECGTDIAAEFSRADACPELWAFEVEVGGGELGPSELELSAEQPGTVVQFERSSDGRGCARDTVRSSSQGFTGRLVIHAVNDECIVGEFIDLSFPTNDLADISGVFVAERC